jgi:para-nitrobenzyl esterase
MDAQLFLGSIYADYSSMAPAAMNIDGEYIKVGGYQEAWEEGALEGVDVLVGTNLGEATYDTTIANAQGFHTAYQELLGDLYDEYDVANLISVVNANANDMARILASYGFATTESRNLTLAQLFGAWHDANTEDGDTYVYLFSHRPPGRNEEEFWAWHSSEMWYAFASLRDIPEQREWEPWDYELAGIMSSYWANFIKFGDPNASGLPAWAPSNSESLAYMEFGDELLLDTEISRLDELMIDFARRQFEVE